VVPVPLGGGGAIPCSRSVSPTALTAASGTGFILGGGCARCFDGSVVAARRASDAAASIEPSACSTSRPAALALWIAPREPDSGGVVALAHALHAGLKNSNDMIGLFA